MIVIGMEVTCCIRHETVESQRHDEEDASRVHQTDAGAVLRGSGPPLPSPNEIFRDCN